MTTAGRTSRIGILAAACAALLLAAPAARATYGWPVKPFHAQHPVRGFFGDPRIYHYAGTIHFGIDVCAPDGTAVYATANGIASIHPLHADVVVVSAGATVLEYWHVVPAVRPGTRVLAYRTVVGHVEAPWRHVHLAEMRNGVYVNPLRPGALAPYRDTTRPSVTAITFERDGTPAGSRLQGTVDLVAQAQDAPPLAPPAPWNAAPVAPALLEWRLAGTRAATAWHVAFDVRGSLPASAFSTVYAKWTRQNHPDRSQLGRYRYLLVRAFDTRSLPNGTYRLVVRAADTRGNSSTTSRAFTVANGV